MDKLPKDIYRQCVAIAGAYYTLLARRKAIEEEICCTASSLDGVPSSSTIGNPTARTVERLILATQRNEWKIKCIEQALCQMADNVEREFIRKNIFEHIRMRYIELPMSTRTMERVRARYLYNLARELGEI